MRLKVADRPKDLRRDLRNAVAPLIERQAFEDDMGEAAIGGSRAFLGLDQRIDGLAFVAIMAAMFEQRPVDFLAVRPDAADAGDRAFA